MKKVLFWGMSHLNPDHKSRPFLNYDPLQTDKMQSGNVSSMLLYARTTEPTPPYLNVLIGGNRIMVQTLDLGRNFSEIAYTLDQIAMKQFGETIRKIA